MTKQELETIQNLNDDELKKKAEDKKNDENTSEEEKELIEKALPLLDNEEKKKIGKIIIYSVIAKEQGSLGNLLKELVAFNDEQKLIDKTRALILRKMSAISNSSNIPPTPLLPKRESFLTPEKLTLITRAELNKKIKEEEEIINRLKITVAILALTTIISLASNLFLLIKK